MCWHLRKYVRSFSSIINQLYWRISSAFLVEYRFLVFCKFEAKHYYNSFYSHYIFFLQGYFHPRIAVVLIWLSNCHLRWRYFWIISVPTDDEKLWWIWIGVWCFWNIIINRFYNIALLSTFQSIAFDYVAVWNLCICFIFCVHIFILGSIIFYS